MLPKITHALTKHIRPISSSAVQASVDQKYSSKPREEKSDSQEAQSDSLSSSPDEETQKKQELSEESTPIQPSVSSSFLDLFKTLKNGRAQIYGFLGKAEYKKSESSKNTNGKFKKGSMVDRRFG